MWKKVLPAFFMVYTTHCEAETEALGEAFARDLPPGSVVALYGDLGCGKTAFVRGMARGMGLEVLVTSPTFTIVNEYLGDRPLFHFDMYRLQGPEELYDIGWEDYLARKGVCVVEWSENVPGAFEGDEIRIHFCQTGENDREITVEGENHARTGAG